MRSGSFKLDSYRISDSLAPDKDLREKKKRKKKDFSPISPYFPAGSARPLSGISIFKESRFSECLKKVFDFSVFWWDSGITYNRKG